MNFIKFLIAALVAAFLLSCGGEDEAQPLLPPPAQPPVQPPTIVDTSSYIENGIVCTSTTVEAALGYENILITNPNQGRWVGEILLGNSVVEGTYVPITSSSQKPLQLSCSLPGIEPIKMDNPSLANYRASLNEMFESIPTGSTPAQINFTIEDVYSEEQLKLILGTNFNNSFLDIKSRFDFSRSDIQSRKFVKFEQIYYTIDADNFSSVEEILSPSDVAGLSVSPVVVTQCKYGRSAFWAFESTESEAKLQAALDAAFSYAGNNGSLSLSIENQNILKNSSVKGLIIGGAAGEAVKSISGYQGLVDWILSGGNFSKDSPGELVGFSMRLLSNGQLFSVVIAGNYTIVNCQSINAAEPYEVELSSSVLYALKDRDYKHVAGDQDFFGKAQFTGKYSLTLNYDSTKVYLNISTTILEPGPGGDGTKGLDDDKLTLFEAPSGYKIASFASSVSTIASYLDNDTSLDLVFPTGLIQKIESYGDTDGKDLGVSGDQSRYTLFLNPVIVNLVK